MAERFTYEKRYWYPHMMPADVAIWERFIEKNPDAYDWCEYDVKVGSLPVFDTTANPESGGKADDLYKRKIDVVAYKDGRLDIIELKPRAGSSALGQVKGYTQLYLREYAPSLPVRMVLMTDALLPDMDFLAETEGISLIIV